MPSGATTIELLGNGGEVIDFTVANEVPVEKGDLLNFGTARELSGAALYQTAFAGIASTEKVASDGQTNLGLYTKGIFDLTINAVTGVTAGDTVVLSGANVIATDEDATTATQVGIALETGAANTQVEVAVGVY